MNRWNRIFRAQRARNGDGAGDFNSDVPERIKITLTDVGYYETLSSRYGMAQTLGIVLLALYLCLTLMTNPALLASERLTYFVKDMVTAASLWDGAADDTLTYTADGQGTQLLFRDGLAAVSESDVTLFSSTGRQLYSEDLHYASPVTCASGRYLIIYDLGGKEYSVYNSFARIAEQTAEYPIRGAAAADNGSFCLITEDVEYASQVVLLDDRFRTLSRYRLEQYAVCACFAEQGERLAIASVSSDHGRLLTHVLAADVGAQSERFSVVVEDAYPVEIAYTDRGELLLLTTKGLYLFNEKGEQSAYVSVDAERVSCFALTSNGCVLVERGNTPDPSTKVTAIDKRLREVYNVSVDAYVQQACFDGEVLGILCENSIRAYQNGDNDRFVGIDFDGKYQRLLICDGGDFLVCGDAEAIVIRASSLHSKEKE